MTLPDWAFSPWLSALCLGLLALFKLPRPGADATAPLTWRDAAIATLCGLTVMVVASQFLSVGYMDRCAVTAPDIEEFCATVHGLRSRSPGWVVRQPGAGLLPSSLSVYLGFMDGLAAGALISSFLIGFGHYLGGRLLLGTFAGVASALLGLTLAPLVVLTGHMTFYPEATAGFLLALVSGFYLMRRPGPRGLLVAGAGVGLALMVDFVGLLLSAPIVLVAGGVALKGSGWRRRALGVALFAGPILLSFLIARSYTPRAMSGFEEEIQFYIQDVGGSIPLLGPDLLKGGGTSALIDPILEPSADGDGLIYQLPIALRARLPSLHSNLSGQSYIWGHTLPWELPKILLRIALFSGTQQAPSQRFVHGERSVAEARQNQVLPLLPPMALGLLLTLIALRRRPWIALGLVLMLLPFGLSLRYQAMTRVLPRFLMAPLVPVPLLMGVGFVFLLTRVKEGVAPLRRWGSGVALTFLLAALILGVFPSHISPRAPWRVQVVTINSALLQIQRQSAGWRNTAINPGKRMHPCEPVARVDYGMGRDPWGHIHPSNGCEEAKLESVGDAQGMTLDGIFKRLPYPESLRGAP